MFLSVYNSTDKVKGFLITKKKVDKINIYDKQVNSIEEIGNQLKKERIIIAISPRKSSDVYAILDKYEIYNYVQMTDWDYEFFERELIVNSCKQKLNDHSIIFYSFWGLGYSGNCKYIANKIHEMDKNLDLFWIVSEAADLAFPDWITPVVFGSLFYYLVFFTSKFVISDVDYPFQGIKRKGQYYISTWHGIGPSKKLDWSITSNRTKEKRCHLKADWNRSDILIAGSRFCHYVYRESFLFDGTIKDWGYPRNDVLFCKRDLKTKIHKYFDIDRNKRIALYAPTFRNELIYSKDTARLQEIYDLDLEKAADRLQARFNACFVILYRFHHYVYRYLDISKYHQFGIDVTHYPDMQELLVATDVLITDYSSSMWDFSLMRKPVFLYYHDADVYEEKYQGFYVFPDEYPYPKGHSTEELCDAIDNFDEGLYQKKLDEWFEKYGKFDDGHASERVVNRILEVIDYTDKSE